MVTCLFVVSVLLQGQAEPGALSEPWMDYFRRTEIARDDLSKSLKQQAEDLEIKIRGEAAPQKKANLRRQLVQAEKSLAELKRSRVTAFLPNEAEVASIGALRPGKVRAVIDDHVAVIDVVHVVRGGQKRTYRFSYVITLPETNRLKVDHDFESPELWRVTGEATTDDRITRALRPHFQLRIVEPIKKPDVEKARAAYEELN